MLTEQRYDIILKLLQEKGTVTIGEILEILDASESTVRRDITALHKAGKLVKVFGGAVAVNHNVVSNEPTVAQKVEMNMSEKKKIAAYAVSLIQENEFIFMDAGTTTECMIDVLPTKNMTIVTNGVVHARLLAAAGHRVILLGGELKGSTEAVVGNAALRQLMDYHFTKGFFGTNGVTRTTGLTTPDAGEALIKRTAMEHCRDCFVLADSSKFDIISSVTFAPFDRPVIITDREIEGYKDCKHVIVVK